VHLFGNETHWRAIKAMTDTDLVRNPAIELKGPVSNDYRQYLEWPVLGIVFSFFCTIAWCAFLIWLII
jgi:hypothetical protein